MSTDEVLLNEPTQKKRKLTRTWSFWIGIILFLSILIAVLFTVGKFDSNEDNSKKWKRNFWVVISGTVVSLGFIAFGYATTKYENVNDYGNKLKRKTKYAGNEAAQAAVEAAQAAVGAGSAISSYIPNVFIPGLP